MAVKLLPQLRFLKPSLPVARIPSIKLGCSTDTCLVIPIFAQTFPFELKNRGFGPPAVGSQVGARRFSTRSFRAKPPGSGSRYRGGEGGEVRASKSLIEDEAELSDWVGDLRSNSFRGRVSSEDESDSGGARGGRFSDDRGRGRGRDGFRDDGGRGRDRDGFRDDRGRGRDRDGGREGGRRNGERGGFSTRGRNPRDSGEFGESSSRRIPGRGDSFSRDSRVGRRPGNGEEGKFNSWGRNRGNVGLKEGRRGGGGERDFGFKRDRGGGERDFGFKRDRGGEGRDFGFKRDGRGVSGKRSFIEDDDDVEDDDESDIEESRKGLMESFGDLISEEETEDSDDDGAGVLKKNVASSLGAEKEFSFKDRPSSSGPSDSYLSETRFDQCPVSPLSLKGIKDAGYERMTVVQEATLPVILKGKDVLAKAKTGTGKTVAFLLPSIEVIVNSPPVDRDQKRPPILVLVICPTRELASQAAKEANTLLKHHPSIGVQVVIGGTRLALEQRRMQANPCQILVATPGRLRDHIENTAGFATRLMGVKVLVLDEADHLLDMGFRKEIEKIIAAVPKQRQTLLFSATVPEEVRQICHIALKRDHEYINTVQEGSEETHAQVRQMHLVAPLENQFALLYTLLKDHIADDVDYKVLVFCTTAMVTKLVAELLGELRLNVREIHSRKAQSYRTKVSDEFRKSKGLILVTSDVSARGVDYPDVTLVIQLGLPADREQYIHRLGRTGRKGKEGQGILLLAPWEEFFLSSIKDLPLTKAPMPLIDPDTKKKVEKALSHVQMKSKESAYQAWLGFYNSNKNVGRDKYRLVELANEFSRTMGLDNPPAIAKVILGKMGLRNVPGLRTK
ncbi:hypothetical protein Tsubulata_026372 [Turnera subulata]|uniref:ATP-dependent RNA helicase n=1 Tax=Turnera subulata TaxID=218843 RepID=A0A9Q0FTJ6_9ROSI|nr:hypothetical protein Tsubulata_026372 [Turnera subulata]